MFHMMQSMSDVI